MHFCPECGKPGVLIEENRFKCVDHDCRCIWKVNNVGGVIWKKIKGE